MGILLEEGVNAAKNTKLQTLDLKIWIPKFQISLEWRVWSTITKGALFAPDREPFGRN